MFREKRLIQKGPHGERGGDGGVIKKVTSILNPFTPREDVYNELHNNRVSGPWNSEKIAKAQEAAVPIKKVMDEVRTEAKNVFWKIPKEWSKSFARMLANPVLLIPAGLNKIVQLPEALAKIVTSGILVVNAEFWQALNAPARLAIRAYNKAIKALGGGGAGGGVGGGHGASHGGH